MSRPSFGVSYIGFDEDPKTTIPNTIYVEIPYQYVIWEFDEDYHTAMHRIMQMAVDSFKERHGVDLSNMQIIRIHVSP